MLAQLAGAVVQAVLDRVFNARLRAHGRDAGQRGRQPLERRASVQHFYCAKYAENHADLRHVRLIWRMVVQRRFARQERSRRTYLNSHSRSLRHSNIFSQTGQCREQLQRSQVFQTTSRQAQNTFIRPIL